MSTNNLASSAQGGRGRIPQGRTQALASISVYPDLESPGLSISGWKAAEEMGFCKIEFGTWHNGACTTTPNSTSDGFYILGANGRSHSSRQSKRSGTSGHCPTTCQSGILQQALELDTTLRYCLTIRHTGTFASTKVQTEPWQSRFLQLRHIH